MMWQSHPQAMSFATPKQDRNCLLVPDAPQPIRVVEVHFLSPPSDRYNAIVPIAQALPICPTTFITSRNSKVDGLRDGGNYNQQFIEIIRSISEAYSR